MVSSTTPRRAVDLSTEDKINTHFNLFMDARHSFNQEQISQRYREVSPAYARQEEFGISFGAGLNGSF